MKKLKVNMLVTLIGVLLLLALPAGVFAEEGAGLSISITTDKSSAAVGENVTYTYFISNTGNVTMDNILLHDENLGDIPLGTTALVAGDNTTAVGIYTVTESDLPGPLVTSANVTGADPDEQPVIALSALVSVTLVSADNDEPGNPELTIGLSADKESASVGDNITFTYLVSNSGNVTMDNFIIQHENVGSVFLSVSLLPGDNVTASGMYTVVEAHLPGPLVTSAIVTGTDPDAQVISATSSSVSIILTAADDDDIEPPVRTKAWILRQLGVPGKGIDHAPGLQKQYNPNSKAAMKLERFMERNTVQENAEIKVKNKNKNKNKNK